MQVNPIQMDRLLVSWKAKISNDPYITGAKGFVFLKPSEGMLSKELSEKDLSSLKDHLTSVYEGDQINFEAKIIPMI